jgi:anthranilate synthase component 2
MKLLILDNYDSFTYNLVHYLEVAGVEVITMRNDKVNYNTIDDCHKIVFSPGPGLPKNAGKMRQIINKYAGEKPMLGVCLGFQAIVEYYHGQLFNQEDVKHGVAEKCRCKTDSRLFQGLPQEINVGLYHSWAAKPDKFPRELIVTATSESGVIMAFEHKRLPICGVQFHPESILTEQGMGIIRNFIRNFN